MATIEQQRALAMASARLRLQEQAPQPAPQVAEERSMVDKIVGVGEAGLSAISAIPAAVAGSAAGIYQTVTGGKYGTQEGIQQGAQRAQEVTRDLTYAPSGEAGREYLQDLGKVIDQSKIAGIGPPEAMLAAGGAAAAAPRIATAIANSPEAEMLGRGARAAGRAVVPMPPQEVVTLARRAVDMNIPLRPDMLTNNRFMRMLGEAFEKVPLSGSREEARQLAFNRAVIGQIGGDRNAMRLTPDVFRAAMDDAGGTIGDIARQIGRASWWERV